MKFPRVLAVVAPFALVAVAFGHANWPAASLPTGTVADSVVVRKHQRELVLLRQGVVLKRYRVALGRSPVGPKAQEGDRRTPEGLYTLDYRNAKSSFHLSLHVSYPDAKDAARAARMNVPAGSLIMIHGLRNGLGFIGKFHRVVDWTNGCIAVTNPEIEEIWRCVQDGTPVKIMP